MNQTLSRDFTALIRDVPDFPKPGIRFKDITPLLADPEGFAWVVDTLAVPWRGSGVDCVVGIEARGFILGAAALESSNEFIPAGGCQKHENGFGHCALYETGALNVNFENDTLATSNCLEDWLSRSSVTINSVDQSPLQHFAASY